MKLLDVLGVLGVGIGVILLIFGNGYGLIGLLLGCIIVTDPIYQK